jgi:3alpha(or 20beta)-hydroxysteroid dehydrogenase
VGPGHHRPPGRTARGVTYRRLDVTDADGWAAVTEEITARHPAVHGLVANAGVTWRARLTDLDPADLERVHDVNVTGPLLGIQTLSPYMTLSRTRPRAIRVNTVHPAT